MLVGKHSTKYVNLWEDQFINEKSGEKTKLHEMKKEVQYNFCYAKTEPLSQQLRHQSPDNTSTVHLQPMMLSADSDLPDGTPMSSAVFRAGTDNPAQLLVRIPKDPVSVVMEVVLEGGWC